MANIQGLRNNPPITPASKDIPIVTEQFKVSIRKLSGQLQELLDHPDLKDDPEFLKNMKKSIIELAETSKQINQD
jgi:hypothetical protein